MANSRRKPSLLVCVNEKEHSRTALRFACEKARVTGSVVEMLYVLNPVDYNTIFSVADVIKEDRKIEAESLLTSLADDVHKWCGVVPIFSIREGRVTDAIISRIEEDGHISLLIMGAAPDGSTSKSGLLQQLTDAIGNRFHIPLLIVPGNLTDQQIKALN